MSDQDQDIPTSQSNTSRNSSYSSSSSTQNISAVSECLGAWLNYLQVLNNLCGSGYKLAKTIYNLEELTHSDQTGANSNPQASSMNFQFITAWDDLQKSSLVATSTVKAHIISVLQDYITQPLSTFEQEADIQRAREHNNQIVSENAQTMINLQHQFCGASYEMFSPLMCCFMCQTPVGFNHESDCAVLQQQSFTKMHNSDLRSQTPSPHFGTTLSRSVVFDRGSGSTQGSSDHSCALTGIDQVRGPSPHHDRRGPSPQGFLDNIRVGPLPNPGLLIGMKAPFYRGSSRSPLNFPLFPLSGQRRWSEAGHVSTEESALDAESHMRRWSMPWEASKTDRNTVSWHQTRIMPISKLAVPIDRGSQSTTPENWQSSSVTSQDGLAEAIQLLSCRPGQHSRSNFQQGSNVIMGQPFIEEAPHSSNYGVWPTATRPHDRLPFIKFPKEQDKSFDENPPP